MVSQTFRKHISRCIRLHCLNVVLSDWKFRISEVIADDTGGEGEPVQIIGARVPTMLYMFLYF